MTLIGELSLWIALLMAAWGAVVSFAGGALRRRDLAASGERAIYVAFAALLLAAAGVWTALLGHDFSFAFVALQTNFSLPRAYAVAALWSGQAGAMLFWSLLLAACASVAVFTHRGRDRDLMPWATGTMGAALLFLLLIVCLDTNPYDRLGWMPTDGRGLDPVLRDPRLFIQPPLLFLGYVATAIPFAFSVAALVARRFDAAWARLTRRWTLVAWFLLTVAIALGMRWTYGDPTRSGYWNWRPAENASLLTWLAASAVLHALAAYEKRGALRAWSVVLVAATFLLSLLGAFMAWRGTGGAMLGVSRSSLVGWLGVGLVVVGGTAYLVAARLHEGARDATVGARLGRAAGLAWGSALLAAIAGVLLVGTVVPLAFGWLRGSPLPDGAPFLNGAGFALGLLAVASMALATLLPWNGTAAASLPRMLRAPAAAGIIAVLTLAVLGVRGAGSLAAACAGGLVIGAIAQDLAAATRARRAEHAEGAGMALARVVAGDRRRYGGYVAHVGMALALTAFAGMFVRSRHTVTVRAGGTATLGDPYGHVWQFVSQGVSRYGADDRNVSAVSVESSRDGAPRGLIVSERRQYLDAQGQPLADPMPSAGIRTSPMLDTYVVLAGTSGDTARLDIAFNPLVAWVWAAGVMIALGGLIVMWPRAEPARVAATDSAGRSRR
ncbi:MAG: heme lyase CcmF/NrfE family subunit [Gemmatimonadaceae bacterium]